MTAFLSFGTVVDLAEDSLPVPVVPDGVPQEMHRKVPGTEAVLEVGQEVPEE